MAKSILCVHQGYELYGSDRVFIQSIEALKECFPESSLSVHLPQSGSILEEMGSSKLNLIIGNLWILRFSNLHLKGLWKSLRYCHQLRQQHDLIYINTTRVLPYLLLGLCSRKKTIIHVHEINHGLLKFVINSLVKYNSGLIIANSDATAQNSVNAITVYNGSKDQALPVAKSSGLPLKLLLIGRINSWKGQCLAIDALHLLKQQGFKNFSLRIVGSIFDSQTHFIQKLQNKIRHYNLQDHIEFCEFDHDPSSHYQWADVTLVPSLKPEPFGLVATEAMSWSLPVIAANHGGLAEIVIDNQTGKLFMPKDAKALSDAILNYIDNPAILQTHGNAGRERFLQFFHKKSYQHNFQAAVKKYVAQVH